MLKMLKTLIITAISLFLATVGIYWFNLDTKLVALLQPFMTKHYDSIERDKRL